MIEINDDRMNCPKCHASLPAGLYEGTGTTCPSCGLVFSKYRAAQIAADRSPHKRSPAPMSESHWLFNLLAVPESVSPARFYASVIGWVVFMIWGLKIAMLDYRTGEINQSFLHGPLLIFHEAGHVIFRLFGEFITVLGGTLGQLLMPAVMLVALLRQNKDTLGASLALWLLGISLLDIAPYTYDALTPQLILLNGATGEDGGHDWIYILRKIGMLQHAQTLGGIIYLMGILTLLTSAIWAGTLLRKQWYVMTNRETDQR